MCFACLSFIFDSEIFIFQTNKQKAGGVKGICIFLPFFYFFFFCILKLKHLFINREWTGHRPDRTRRGSINKNRIKAANKGRNIKNETAFQSTTKSVPSEWICKGQRGCGNGHGNGLQQARILVFGSGFFLPSALCVVFVFDFGPRFGLVCILVPLFVCWPAKCFHTNLARRRFFWAFSSRFCDLYDAFWHAVHKKCNPLDVWVFYLPSFCFN